MVEVKEQALLPPLTDEQVAKAPQTVAELVLQALPTDAVEVMVGPAATELLVEEDDDEEIDDDEAEADEELEAADEVEETEDEDDEDEDPEEAMRLPFLSNGL